MAFDDTKQKISSDKPLDGVVAALVEKQRDNGFTLDVARQLLDDGDPSTKIVFEVKETLPVHDEWVPPAALRAHTLHDTESLVAFAKKYGSKEKSLIVYNDQGFRLMVDDFKVRGEREQIACVLKESAEWTAWLTIMSKPQNHRDLLAFLIRHQHTLGDESLRAIDEMRKIKATFTVNMDSDIRLDEESAGVVFKAQAGDSLIKFPRQLGITVPVLDVDVSAGNGWVGETVMVEVILPKEANQGVTFQLHCPTWTATRRLRSDRAAQEVLGALTDWVIVRGDVFHVDQVLGGE